MGQMFQRITTEIHSFILIQGFRLSKGPAAQCDKIRDFPASLNRMRF